jgi:hypothetical protein
MAKQNYWVRFFLAFDYFGVNLAFRKSEDEDAFTSVIGGVIFIIVFILSSYYCAINFIPFVTRQSYTSISSTKTAPNTYISFNTSGINVGYNIIYDANNTVISDELAKYFIITPKIVKVVNSVKNETIRLNSTKCTPEHFYNKPQFSQLKGESFYCVNQTQLAIEGSWATAKFQYIDFTVALDPKVMANNTQYYIDLFSKNSLLFNMIYMESTLDLDEVDDAVNTYITSFITFIDFWTVKKINFYFSQFTFQSDEDLFVEDYKELKSFNQNGEFYQYETAVNDRSVNPNGLTLLKVYIRSSPNALTITRQYTKLSGYLADMSGLVSNVLIIIYFITNCINNFVAESSIMNRMLCYKDFIVSKNQERYVDLIKEIRNKDRDVSSVRQGGDETCLSKSPMQDTPLTENTNRIHNFNIQNPDGKSAFDVKPIEMHKGSRKPVDFNPLEILFRPFLCSKRQKLKSEIYEKSLSKLYYYLSIFTYIRVIQSVDILKHILLDEDQRSIFNYVSRPNVGFGDDENDISREVMQEIESKNHMTVDEIKDLIRSYKTIKGDNEKASLKLCQLFNTGIDQLANN